MDTNKEYDAAMQSCKDIFLKKTIDYGTSWRTYRIISVADQVYIKAKRIRTIQEKGEQKISDDIAGEFKGILNYAIIGLIQLGFDNDEVEELPVNEVEKLYNNKVALAKQLMLDKNHDYGEAWREMSQESFVDLIMAKLLRIKQILKNKGKLLMSEGIDANLFDIVNYAAFALILMNEGSNEV